MIGLKTLKDLYKQLEDEGWTHEDSIPDPDMIKDAAIEWVENWEKCKPGDKLCKEFDIDITTWNEGGPHDFIVKWIKHFFNLKEEDLK